MAREILSGDRALVGALRGIEAVTSTGLDGVARDALEPIRAQTSTNFRRYRRVTKTIPKGGHLDQGVVIRKTRGTGKVFREFWVSLTKRARSIGHLVELGTAPHWQPLRKRMHPGARPHPGMAPAFEEKKSETVALVGSGTWALIQRAALAVGKRVR